MKGRVGGYKWYISGEHILIRVRETKNNFIQMYTYVYNRMRTEIHDPARPKKKNPES